MPDDEIITIQDLAKLLRIGEKTAYTMAKTGRIPGFKVGGQWRFRRADINVWIRRQISESNRKPDGASIPKRGGKA
jgi:excisionase family DNA binding protein